MPQALLLCLALFLVWPATNSSAQDSASPNKPEDGFQTLFNGLDLTGWQGDPKLWTVQDGCITGITTEEEPLPYNKFLIWDGTASDFEFRCEFRLEGKNNSGVQYRSVHDPSRGEFVCVGYQADIHANPNYTGMLYDEKGRGIIAQRGQKVIVTPDGKKEATPLDVSKAPIDLTEWHTLTIIAQGNRLIHKIDDVVTVDITDNQEAEREMDGVLAFQVHRGPAMKAQFRNVRLKKLTAATAPGVKASPNEPPVSNSTPSSKDVLTTQNSKMTQSTGSKPFAVATPAKQAKPKQAANKNNKQVARVNKSDAPTPAWIWLTQEDKPADKVYFRKDINSGGVGAARLYAACDDMMKIYVDGVLVAESTNWQKPVFVDITKQLDLDDPNKNHVIAIEGQNGKSAAGLVVRLDLESGWRDAWSVVSDSTWEVNTQPADGWMKPGFQPAEPWKNADVIAALGSGPWGSKVSAETLAAAAPLKDPEATPAESLKVADGFKVDLLYTVPRDEQGSWVNMCVDPKGRLIVSDQYGKLYRITLPATDSANQPHIESIPVDIGEAQGLLWAFDSLYVSVNRGQKYSSGLYRIRDTDNDDQLDTLETLRVLNGGGEHGPHAVLPHPDGKSLVIVCGNGTELTDISSSRLPSWDEDLLLPRVKGRFMVGKRAPGGCIYKIDPDGRTWELLAAGFRNQFDAAFDQEGELFAYDADMEWDINAPWYRPTRICHVVSGAEFGWRSSAGKWPIYYADSVPPVVNIGPGSPTGVAFGYGAAFPEKYQQALYACDWSYGKLYAVHLKPQGATFSAELEEFITGTPLPLTDLVVNPMDGAMYFAIGGRKVQSGLYRVTHQQTLAANQRKNTLRIATARKSIDTLGTAASQLAEPEGGAIVATDLPQLQAAAIAAERKISVVDVPLYIDANNTIWTSATTTADDASLNEIFTRFDHVQPHLVCHPESTHETRVRILDIAAQHEITAIRTSIADRNPLERDDPFAGARQQRRDLEALHFSDARADAVRETLQQIDAGLASSDRSIRYAARIALEHQALERWAQWASQLNHPDSIIQAAMAIARSHTRSIRGDKDEIDSPIPDWTAGAAADANHAATTTAILEMIDKLDTASLSVQQQIDMLRALSLTFVRVAPPNSDERDEIIRRLENGLPASAPELNSMLAQLAVYLQAPYAAAKLVPMMLEAPTQEEQIEVAATLRHLKTGWTPELQEAYFGWFVRASTYRGGATFALYIDNIKADAVSMLSQADRQRLQPLLDKKPESDAPVFTAAPREFVRNWSLDELVPMIQNGLTNRNFDHGRRMFAAASCFACHRFDNQGGSVGPDLTALSGRFSPRDLLESIVEPSKVISDQYGSVQIITLDGKVINGRIINLAGDSFRIQTNMLEPGALVGVDRKQIEEMTESKISMMPTGLLNTLNQEEVLYLFAYLLSRGDRSNKMFSK